MRIGDSRPIRKPIPLTPLVDIVFLLLMFFMLSSTFTKFGTLAAAAQDSSNDVPVTSAQQFPGAIVLVGSAGAMTVNGYKTAAEDLPAKLDALREKGVTLVAIRANKSATVQDLVTVLDFARRSQIPDIVVVP